MKEVYFGSWGMSEYKMGLRGEAVPLVSKMTKLHSPC